MRKWQSLSHVPWYCRYCIVFANRSRMRPLLSPPPCWEIPGIGTEPTAEFQLGSREKVEVGPRGEGAPAPRRTRHSLPYA